MHPASALSRTVLTFARGSRSEAILTVEAAGTSWITPKAAALAGPYCFTGPVLGAGIANGYPRIIIGVVLFSSHVVVCVIFAPLHLR